MLSAFDPNTYRKALASQSALYAGQDDIEGDLCYVVALAMDDSRLNELNFIRKHPEYKFIFLTDPHLESSNSAIAKFFVGKGVPRNAFVDPKGRIVEYRVGGYEGKTDAVAEMIDKWMAQLKTAE